MKPLTEADIRSSFVNASRGDADRLWLPGLHEVVWEDREYLGWRDIRSPLRGAIVFWRGEMSVGLMLRAAETSMNRGRSAMCLLCQTPQPADQVSLFSAPRAGDRGRNGDSVGTYICADLGCSHMIRMGLPPKSDMTPPADHVVAHRAAGLGQRLEGFTANVLKTA